MLSSNKITEVFDNQYQILAFDNTRCVWPVMSSDAQTCLSLPWSVDGIATIEVIQNERLLEF